MVRSLFRLTLVGLFLYLFWPYNVFQLKDHNPHITSLIEIRKEEALRKSRKMKPEMEWRTLDQISPALIHAVLLAEDDRFYVHHGFDLEQILIAVQRNWQK